MIVESTRWWHAWKCSENISTRADPRVQEPTRPERPIWWQAVRADSNTSEPTRPEEFKVCRARRADSNCKESTRSINRADSKTSEPTRTMHTDRIMASFFSLTLFQNLKRLDFKSQRSESWKLSLKAHEAPLKKREKGRRRRKEEKGLFFKKTLNPIKYPRRAKENQKLLSSPQQKSKGLLEKSRRSSEAKEAHIQNLLQAFQAATSDN